MSVVLSQVLAAVWGEPHYVGLADRIWHSDEPASAKFTRACLASVIIFSSTLENPTLVRLS